MAKQPTGRKRGRRFARHILRHLASYQVVIMSPFDSKKGYECDVQKASCVIESAEGAIFWLADGRKLQITQGGDK